MVLVFPTLSSCFQRGPRESCFQCGRSLSNLVLAFPVWSPCFQCGRQVNRVNLWQIRQHAPTMVYRTKEEVEQMK